MSANQYLLWRVFIIHMVNFANLHGVLIAVNLSVVVSTYKSI